MSLNGLLKILLSTSNSPLKSPSSSPIISADDIIPTPTSLKTHQAWWCSKFFTYHPLFSICNIPSSIIPTSVEIIFLFLKFSIFIPFPLLLRTMFSQSHKAPFSYTFNFSLSTDLLHLALAHKHAEVSLILIKTLLCPLPTTLCFYFFIFNLFKK